MLTRSGVSRAFSPITRDLAPHARSRPETGLGRGWEAPALIILALAMVAFGLLALYSATFVTATQRGLAPHHYVLGQLAGVAPGLAGLAVAALAPIRIWEKLAAPIAVGTAALLILVVLPWTHVIAPEINGARRWIRLGIAVQPSDFAKFAVIALTASIAAKKVSRLRKLSQGILPMAFWWVLLAGLTALGPDFSTACLILAVGVTIAFTAGARLGHFVFLGSLAIAPAAFVLRQGYRGERWASILPRPTDTPTAASFQAYQSHIALGSGGLSGVGVGNSRQKYGYLPEGHNDFILSLIGEEWGFLGVLFVILAFAGIVVIGFRIAAMARDRFSELLAVGVVSLIALQAALHIGVNLGILPTTGLALPFISFGRTSAAVLLATLGILVRVAIEAHPARARGGQPAPGEANR